MRKSLTPPKGHPRLVLDGANCPDLAAFAAEFSKSILKQRHRWNGNLDAFNDILRGGFGTPDGGFVFEIQNAHRLREGLGWAATQDRLSAMLKTCHPASRTWVTKRLRMAQQKRGLKLFDEIIEIIECHGPGGEESEDQIFLVLN